MNFILGIITVVAVLVNVAFFTLLERKILGLSQARKGPNKLSIVGITQPFADAVKLFLKQFIKPFLANKALFLFAPAFAILLASFLWTLSPSQALLFHSPISLVLILVVFSVNLYPLLVSGWASNSTYATLGAMRGVAQTISYEISLTLISTSPLILIKSLSIHSWNPISLNTYIMWMAPVIVLWLICCVAETNRAPFDFSEGESELVSGFNIEYGGPGFAFVFMAEYAVIILFSTLTSIFFSGQVFSALFSVAVLFFMIFWVWIRSSFPRHRYDLLMSLSWKGVLPLALSLTAMVLSISLI